MEREDTTWVGDRPLDVRIDHRGDGTVVATVAGEVDAAGSPQLQRALDTAWSTRPGRLVVDLTGLSFLGVPGLRVLLAATDRASAATVPWEVRARPGHVTRLLGWVGWSARRTTTTRRGRVPVIDGEPRPRRDHYGQGCCCR